MHGVNAYFLSAGALSMFSFSTEEIADFVTKTNNEDGVAYAIEKLVFEA